MIVQPTSILLREFLEHERERFLSRRRTLTVAQRAELRVSAQVMGALDDYRRDWVGGRLGAVKAHHLREFLLEFAPRRLLVTPEERLTVPRILARHCHFLGVRGHLPVRAARCLAVYALVLGRQYRALAALQPGQPGSVRALLRGAVAEGIDIQDSGALSRYGAMRGLDLHEEFAPVWTSI